MKIFKEILSKNKEKYIQDLEDLIRLSKYSTNSVQDYLSDKFTSLNCINFRNKDWPRSRSLNKTLQIPRSP